MSTAVSMHSVASARVSPCRSCLRARPAVGRALTLPSPRMYPSRSQPHRVSPRRVQQERVEQTSSNDTSPHPDTLVDTLLQDIQSTGRGVTMICLAVVGVFYRLRKGPRGHKGFGLVHFRREVLKSSWSKPPVPPPPFAPQTLGTACPRPSAPASMTPSATWLASGTARTPAPCGTPTCLETLRWRTCPPARPSPVRRPGAGSGRPWGRPSSPRGASSRACSPLTSWLTRWGGFGVGWRWLCLGLSTQPSCPGAEGQARHLAPIAGVLCAAGPHPRIRGAARQAPAHPQLCHRQRGDPGHRQGAWGGCWDGGRGLLPHAMVPWMRLSVESPSSPWRLRPPDLCPYPLHPLATPPLPPNLRPSGLL